MANGHLQIVLGVYQPPTANYQVATSNLQPEIQPESGSENYQLATGNLLLGTIT